jgi:hypothetical protein
MMLWRFIYCSLIIRTDNFVDSGLEWEVAGNWKEGVECVGGSMETKVELAFNIIGVIFVLTVG